MIQRMLFVAAIAILIALHLEDARAADPSWFSKKEPLARAHAAFLERDLGSMSLAIKEALEASDQAATKQNALRLLEKAFEVGEGKLPADWRAPSGVSSLRVLEIRKEEPEHLMFSIRVSGEIDAPDTVTQVQLVQAPNRVILDRRAALGEWEAGAHGGTKPFFTLTTPDGEAPLEDGLYYLNLETKGGESVHGWFVLQGLLSSASPRVQAPAPGQTFDTAHPRFAWEDFRSPEHKTFEPRTLAVFVSKANVSTWHAIWHAIMPEAGAVEATVNPKDKYGMGVPALEDGDYWFSLGYVETRRFGDLMLQRASKTARPFHVRNEQKKDCPKPQL